MLRYCDGEHEIAALSVADAEACWNRPLDLDGALVTEAGR